MSFIKKVLNNKINCSINAAVRNYNLLIEMTSLWSHGLMAALDLKWVKFCEILPRKLPFKLPVKYE